MAKLTYFGVLRDGGFIFCGRIFESPASIPSVCQAIRPLVLRTTLTTFNIDRLYVGKQIDLMRALCSSELPSLRHIHLAVTVEYQCFLGSKTTDDFRKGLEHSLNALNMLKVSTASFEAVECFHFGRPKGGHRERITEEMMEATRKFLADLITKITKNLCLSGCNSNHREINDSF